MCIKIALCVFNNYNIEFFNFCGIENKYLNLRYMQIFNQKNTKDANLIKIRLKYV